MENLLEESIFGISNVIFVLSLIKQISTFESIVLNFGWSNNVLTDITKKRYNKMSGPYTNVGQIDNVLSSGRKIRQALPYYYFKAGQ